MRYALRKKNEQGFTLIELMIVVAIIGILAVLAIFGVRKYLASAKSAEATNTIGAINRAAVAAYNREIAPAELKATGGATAGASNVLCGSSTRVPVNDSDITNKKYTADPAPGKDYHDGTATTSWVCLKFEMSEPQYYAYKYTTGATPGLAANAVPPTGAQWLSEARGNLNGDAAFSGFVTGGAITNGQAITFTNVVAQDPEE